jgi:hypothetical protein
VKVRALNRALRAADAEHLAQRLQQRRFARCVRANHGSQAVDQINRVRVGSKRSESRDGRRLNMHDVPVTVEAMEPSPFVVSAHAIWPVFKFYRLVNESRYCPAPGEGCRMLARWDRHGMAETPHPASLGSKAARARVRRALDQPRRYEAPIGLNDILIIAPCDAQVFELRERGSENRHRR